MRWAAVVSAMITVEAAVLLFFHKWLPGAALAFVAVLWWNNYRRSRRFVKRHPRITNLSVSLYPVGEPEPDDELHKLAVEKAQQIGGGVRVIRHADGQVTWAPTGDRGITVCQHMRPLGTGCPECAGDA